jgi:L-2-hydroxyglutarate oxidase
MPQTSPVTCVRFGVVGGGIVGLAVARELLATVPDASVTVLEKEPVVGSHQTGHNSGVVHAGVYYPPGSLKAQLCTTGRTRLRAYCAEHGLSYDECGKLVIALTEPEQARLAEIFRRATANGVPDVRMVDRTGIGELEPHAIGLAALYSPRTAVVDFAAIARSFAADVTAAGGQVRTGVAVLGAEERGGEVRIRTTAGVVDMDRLVVCAGLQADRVAQSCGDEADPRIVPFRGEYHQLRPTARALVRGLIYPVPDPRYPFLGIHLTRRYDGEVLVGPNAVLALAREGYRRRDISPADLKAALGWPGFRRMARQHWQTGLVEYGHSLSTTSFVRAAQRYVPALRSADVIPAPAGVRAQAVFRTGELADDFVLHRRGRMLHVRNAPSPAATSSLAIAEYVVRALVSD